MATVWKIAPSVRADNWEKCLELRCVVIGWNQLGDCRSYDNQEAILKALKKGRGTQKGCGTGPALTIWRVVHELRPSEVIVANRGDRHVVGIGVVTVPYLHPNHPKNPVPVPGKDEWWRRQARSVDWHVKKEVDLGTKHFFVASTITHLTDEQCDRIDRA